MSYDLPTISQTLPMRRKPIASNIVAESGKILEIYDVTHPTHDVAARGDQCFKLDSHQRRASVFQRDLTGVKLLFMLFWNIQHFLTL